MKTAQKAVLALIIANLIWGAAAPIFKWSLASTPLFTLAFLRFLLATIILLPFTYKHLSIRLRDFPNIFFIAFFGITINISFFFLGLEKSSSINAPIIASSGPVFLILGAALFLKEKITKREIAGSFIGLFGVFLIVINPILARGLDGSIEGNLFFIIAMAGGVISTIMIKKIIKNYRPITLAFWTFAISTVTFFPFFTKEIQTVGFLPDRGLPVIAGIAFGAILSSAVGYFLHNWALKYLPTTETGLFTYIDPVIAVIIAAPLLGEQPTSIFFAGSFLVFFGIYIAEGRIHWHPIHRLFK